LKRAAKLTTEKENYSSMEAKDVARMVEYAADFCMDRGYEPYYLYRQKNMTENLENIGYAHRGKEGLYNILIMEEVQMILALGAGASSKFIDRNMTNGRRFGRVENVKNVAEYISRINEMAERKKNAF
jgi:oxygen-independent coproporphyrinogen-3 oxidase